MATASTAMSRSLDRRLGSAWEGTETWMRASGASREMTRSPSTGRVTSSSVWGWSSSWLTGWIVAAVGTRVEMSGHEGFWKFLNGLGSWLLGLLVLVLLRGYVLSELWEWFVEPLGVRGISVPQAVGISVLASFLTYQQDAKGEDRGDAGRTFAEGFVNGVLFTLVSWGMGSLAHAWMG